MADPAEAPSLLDHAAPGEAAPDEAAGERARRRFYALLLETPLFTPIHEPGAEDAPLRPLVFEPSGGPVALGFDRDARLAAFFGRPTPFATLPGRALVAALAERGLGLGLNLGDAPSATVLDAAAIRWLAEQGGARLVEAEAEAGLVARAPAGAPEPLAAALAGGAEEMTGLLAELWLIRLARAGEARGRLVAVARAAPAARRAGPGVATRLGALAAPFAAEDDPLDVALAEEGEALLVAARAAGAPLHPPPAPPQAPPPAAPEGPPRF